jgi:hypothetical protein
MQCVYWALFLVTAVLTALSFSQGRLMLIKYASVILAVRIMLRLLNFEELEDSCTQNISLQLFCVFQMQCYYVCFQSTLENDRLKSFLMLFWAVCQTNNAGYIRFDSLVNIFLFLLFIGLSYLLLWVYMRLQFII